MKRTFLLVLIIAILICIASAWMLLNKDNESSKETKLSSENQVKAQNYSAPPSALSTNLSPSSPGTLLPILNGFGISIDSWNKQTNTAGDLIFDKRLLYDDGRVSGEKVFIDFGSKEKYFPNSVGAIEYWFYVPLGTKVKAPLDGEVSISYFEHTKDWGINIQSSNSEHIVSFEHLINLGVKEGESVTAGAYLGEASPRNTLNNKIAMIEFAVWKGGDSIVKYCPFDFLDDTLKSAYANKFKQLAKDWETFIGKNVYDEERWVSPGCLVKQIKET